LGHAELAGAIMQSQGFGAGLGAKDDAGFVAALYQRILHRDGEDAGMAYHVEALAAGCRLQAAADRRQAVVAQFLNSGETQHFYLAYANNGVDLF
jgi:hypothetical protein